MTRKQTVAVLGAGGTLGFGMARNLARAGIPVRAWNRTHEKALPLKDDGALVFDTPFEAIRDADVILTILSDADATQTVMFDDDGALTAAGADAIWLQMATIGAHGTGECMELAGRRGLSFVDAPVLGSRQPALDGQLVILGSGPDELRPVLAPVFDAIGSRTMWVGGSGAGSQLKLVVNAWALSVIEGIAESFALAEGLGLDPRLLMEAVAGGPLDPGYLAFKGNAILEHNFEPQFSLELAAKDARLIGEIAERHGLELPMLEAIRDRLVSGVEEHGDQDVIASYLLSAPPHAR